MNTRYLRLTILIVGLLTALLSLAACGPAPETGLDNAGARPTTPPTAAAAPSGTRTTLGGSSLGTVAGGATQTGGIAADPASAAVDARGIPVGFTQDGRPYRGQLDAPVVIEEFSDYQCPFCARYTTETAPSVDQNHIATGNALLIFFDFPLSIHAQAPAASHAARCAGEQGAVAYWAMHDKLFDSVQQWSVNDPAPVFSRLAAELNLDQASFDACNSSDRFNEAIKVDMQLGTQRGVSGTPTFFINGQAVVGAQPVSVFDQAIAAAKNGDLVINNTRPTPVPVTDADVDKLMPSPVTLSSNFAGAIGEPDAPVTIAEFTDFQCPFCATHSKDVLPSIIKNMVETGRVYYVMYDLPLDSLHADARKAATVARCAGEQNAFWEMHDLLFSQQEEWVGQDVTWFNRLAEELKLDTTAFAACASGGRFDAAIQASVDEATALGLQGTPSFFIGGYRVFNGSQSFDVFEQVVGLAERDQLKDAIRSAIGQQLTAQRAQAAQQEPEAPREAVDVPIPDDAIALGDPNAAIVLVEYTDYQCPFCARHYAQTYPQIISEYVDTGLVRYVIKDFPLESIHAQANLASQAAHCANDQGAYFKMHDRLFEQQQEWANNEKAADYFIRYAGELELDTAIFEQCLNSGKYVDLIASQVEEGIGFGIDGTPGFFLNGNYVYGAQPFSVFKQAIDGLLQK